MVRSGFFLLAVLFSYEAKSISNDGFGTITRVHGKAYKLSYPSEQPTGPGPHYKYKNRFYTAAKVRVGDSFVPGNMIRTDAEGRVRIVFNYGDLINVGDDSFLIYQKSMEKSQPHFRLTQGSARIMCRIQGRLDKITVVSPHLSMTLRGGEAYVGIYQQKSLAGSLRGKVSISDILSRHGSMLEGLDSVEVGSDGKMRSQRTLSRGQLMAIQQGTDIGAQSLDDAVMDTQLRLQGMEKEAYEGLLRDLQQTNVMWYEEFVANKDTWKTIDGLMAYVIEKGVFAAPYSHTKKPEPPPEDYQLLEKKFPKDI